MLVRALRQGYYADKLREQDEVFEMAGVQKTNEKRFSRTGVNCSWVVAAEAAARPEPKKPEELRPPGAGPVPGTVPDKAAPDAAVTGENKTPAATASTNKPGEVVEKKPGEAVL